MSISNFIINLINNRRDRIKKKYPGSLGAFFKDGGNNLIYNKLHLNSESVVIDGGGYEGEFIDNVLINFGSEVESYEPLEKEFNNLNNKYINNDKVKIYNFAIFSKNTDLYLNQEGISSYIVKDKHGKNTIKIKAIDIVEIINKKKKIDLLKLNVEGAEYDILNRIIKTNNLNNIKSFLIQYHKSIKNSVELRTEIRSEFKKNNFIEVFNYEFVWEYWRK